MLRKELLIGFLVAGSPLLIYRKYYDIRLTPRLLAVFWAVMSAAGLATEYLFRAAAWYPRCTRK